MNKRRNDTPVKDSGCGPTADRILALARGEIGEQECPPNTNNVKFNTAYYGREVSGAGYPWCCVFIWWLFRQAGASELFYGGGKTAYCPALLSFHRAQAVRGDCRPGDVVFFNFQGGSSAAHVGLCESWDGTYITTIDGNTGTGNEANGGAVMRRRRHKKYIVGAYRPQYEEEAMTQEKFNEMFAVAMRQYRQELRDNDCGDWSQEARQFAVDRGLFAGGTPGADGQPNYMWEDLLTREQAAQLFYSFAKRFHLV